MNFVIKNLINKIQILNLQKNYKLSKILNIQHKQKKTILF
jgi:hypothetical protein